MKSSALASLVALLVLVAIGSFGVSAVRAAGQPSGMPGISFTRTVYPLSLIHI